VLAEPPVAKLKELWKQVMDSLWLVPGALTVAAVVLAVLLMRVDSTLVDGELARDMWWLFGGTAEGGREVLSVIAASIITVTGVVFSITIVALQLASTQLSPRVLRSFMADRPTQVVLGVFIGTFTYALLVLRAVRQSGDDIDGFMPSASITGAVVLMLVSIGFLIFFIHHVARSIQAGALVDRVTRETHEVIRNQFRPAGEESHEAPADVIPPEEPALVRALKAGYILRMDEQDAAAEADDHARRLTVRMERKVGDFVLPGEPLLSVWPAAALDDGLADDLRENVVLGPQRTPHQDVAYGIVELVDIAVKALSPGINDPNTAAVVIDRLCELYHALGQRDLGPAVRRQEDGTVLVLARPDFATLLHAGIDPIRHFGAATPLVALHLIHALRDLAARLEAEPRAAVERCIADVARQAADAVPDAADRDRVRRAAEAALEGVGAATT
jgi:uncharacterized membrane protein